MPQATKAKPKKITPAMQQFHRFKQQYPDCVLFFRMGDFYEMFHDDAVLAHQVMGVTLTQRSEGVPMAGVPFHSVETYLRRMIQAGHRVAVCEQVEDPKTAKGVVKRDVTRVITPGTLTDESLLEEGRENPLAAVVWHEPTRDAADADEPAGGDRRVGAAASIAWAELSTGAFGVTTVAAAELVDELARVNPSELLVADAADDGHVSDEIGAMAKRIGCIASVRPGWQFDPAEALDVLKRQFQVKSLVGFGFADDDPALQAAAGVVHYLLETQRVGGPGGSVGSIQQGGVERIAHLQPPRRFAREQHLVIDETSLRSLEVERTIRSQSVDGSLLGVLQDCRTAMGKRTLRQWLCYPLAQREPIETRQDAVAALVSDDRLLDELRDTLGQVHDVQRMVGRIAVNRATGRDLVGLGTSAGQCRALASLLTDCPTVKHYHDRLQSVADPLSALADQIARTCVDSPPAHLREGGIIRDGFDEQLDEYRSLQTDSNVWLAAYQKDLIEATGITTLKVGYNKVFGYYIEVSAANRDKAPDTWSRKQTLKNAERYITPPLKEYEHKVLGAEQRAVAREQAIFADLCASAHDHLRDLHDFAQVVAELDVLACFARRAKRYQYVRPVIVPEPVLQVTAGRHPVLDELLGDRFVPNDVRLGKTLPADATRDEKERGASGGDPTSLALITGPNMAGKSTYIRQTALITLLAHTGSFVPAEQATVGLCDRIFTRIGASDELHTGQSTFMVEMTETANICHHATNASLVILDEIGRGTSTYDGLSLAWAITEHLSRRGSRTLFATHYHELTELADRFNNVVNLNVTVREWKDQVVFLHRIAAGKTDRSYGIHVAKIAGLPPSVVTRANEILQQLEVAPATGSGPAHASVPSADVSSPAASANGTGDVPPQQADAIAAPAEGQMSLFREYLDHPVVDELKKIELDALTPLQAFDLLRKLREQVK